VVLVRRKKCSLMYDPVKQLMLNFDANWSWFLDLVSRTANPWRSLKTSWKIRHRLNSSCSETRSVDASYLIVILSSQHRSQYFLSL
jgi:hypothetical protein